MAQRAERSAGPRDEVAAAQSKSTADWPDVKSLRSELGLSQAEFADMMGLSVGTVRNWEQGRRVPDGPARVLLSVTARHPEVVMDGWLGSNT